MENNISVILEILGAKIREQKNDLTYQEYLNGNLRTENESLKAKVANQAHELESLNAKIAKSFERIKQMKEEN